MEGRLPCRVPRYRTPLNRRLRPLRLHGHPAIPQRVDTREQLVAEQGSQENCAPPPGGVVSDDRVQVFQRVRARIQPTCAELKSFEDTMTAAEESGQAVEAGEESKSVLFKDGLIDPNRRIQRFSSGRTAQSLRENRNYVCHFSLFVYDQAMTIVRDVEPQVLALCKSFPVVTVTGPRQSGKTTLCRRLFPDKPYVSLESLDQRSFAASDPRAFIAEYADGAVIDEVQRVPELLSYLQVEVDERPDPGRFILTGSANLALLESVSQSLAGRTGIISLLPCSRVEYDRFPGAAPALWDQLWRGGFPAIPDRSIKPLDWFETYVATYVERDVRRMTRVADLSAFQAFLGLLAGRTGQLLNLSGLGADTGVSHNTAKAWLSVLEASYIAFRLQPFHAKTRKRLVKAPKTYFYDTGLACYLLGIRSAEQLKNHPLRGAIFENYVITEIQKSILNSGRRPGLSFFRDHAKHEVDLLVERGGSIIAAEIKSGATIGGDFFAGLQWLSEQTFLPEGLPLQPRLVYGGESRQRRTRAEVIPWFSIGKVQW